MKEPAHLALHPFGQIPTYEEGDLGLFETGAIVFHIAERHAGLLPDNANARARAITWMFAALSTVEPPILELGTASSLSGVKLPPRGAGTVFVAGIVLSSTRDCRCRAVCHQPGPVSRQDERERTTEVDGQNSALGPAGKGHTAG